MSNKGRSTTGEAAIPYYRGTDAQEAAKHLRLTVTRFLAVRANFSEIEEAMDMLRDSVEAKEVKANSTLTVLVYCVAEDDPPDLGKHTWKAAAVPVERASRKQIKLKKPLPGHGGTVFPPDAYGRLFFETPLQAIQNFIAERRLEIESLDRRRAEAARALAWAESQEGVIP